MSANCLVKLSNVCEWGFFHAGDHVRHVDLNVRRFLFAFFPREFRLNKVKQVRIRLQGGHVVSLRNFGRRSRLSMNMNFLQRISRMTLLLPFFGCSKPLRFITIDRSALFPPIIDRVSRLRPMVNLCVRLVRDVSSHPTRVANFHLFTSHREVQRYVIVPFSRRDLYVHCSTIIHDRPPRLLILNLRTGTRGRRGPNVRRLIFA